MSDSLSPWPLYGVTARCTDSQTKRMIDDKGPEEDWLWGIWGIIRYWIDEELVVLMCQDKDQLKTFIHEMDGLVAVSDVQVICHP